jgi:hypothetical protein
LKKLSLIVLFIHKPWFEIWPIIFGGFYGYRGCAVKIWV